MQPTASTHKCGPTGKWEKREIGGARAWKSEKFCRVVCTNSKCNCSSGGSARFTHIFVYIYLFSSAFYFISVYSRYGETFFFYFNTYTNIYIYIYSVCAFYFHFPNGENGKQKRIHTQEKRKKRTEPKLVWVITTKEIFFTLACRKPRLRTHPPRNHLEAFHFCYLFCHFRWQQKMAACMPVQLFSLPPRHFPPPPSSRCVSHIRSHCWACRFSF